MKITHNKLHFERLIQIYRDDISKHVAAISVMRVGMDDLRDCFHSVKESIKIKRTEKGYKTYVNKNGEKYAWISRLVIRVRVQVTTTKKQYQCFSPVPHYQLYFYRGTGSRNLDFVERLKDGTYSEAGILADKRNMITEDEVEILKYYIDEVNYYNARMKLVCSGYLKHMECLSLLSEIL
jgi:hypothetical protein